MIEKEAGNIPLKRLRKWVWTLPTSDISPKQLERYVSSDKLGKLLSDSRRRKQLFKTALRVAARDTSSFRRTADRLNRRYRYFGPGRGVSGAPNFIENDKVRKVLNNFGIEDLEINYGQPSASMVTTFKTDHPINPTTAHLITRPDLAPISDRFKLEVDSDISYPTLAHELGHAVSNMADRRTLMRNELSRYLADEYATLPDEDMPIMKWLINRELNYNEYLANIYGKRIMDAIAKSYPETSADISKYMRNYRPARAKALYTYLYNSRQGYGFNFPILHHAIRNLQGSSWMNNLYQSISRHTGKPIPVVQRYLVRVFKRIEELGR